MTELKKLQSQTSEIVYTCSNISIFFLQIMQHHGMSAIFFVADPTPH